MTVELVLSRKGTLMTRETDAAVAAGDSAPKLIRQLVDRIVMAITVRDTREGFCAAWPIARNPLVWGAEDMSRMVRARKGEGRWLTGLTPWETLDPFESRHQKRHTCASVKKKSLTKTFQGCVGGAASVRRRKGDQSESLNRVGRATNKRV
jgi:hypothetical protein